MHRSHGMTRRKWLSGTAAGMTAMAGAGKATRPNILLILGDNWHAKHAGIQGDPVVRTPAFDRLAREGILFTRAFGTTPSCSPSRASLLTGQSSHRLGEGANLWGTLPGPLVCYTDLLEGAGYRLGFAGKGWGPGAIAESGRGRNPAGPAFRSFEEFLAAGEGAQPFCFWLGSQLPHTPWQEGRSGKTGMDTSLVRIPPHLPDHPQVRDDILNYYCEVQAFDQQAGQAVRLLQQRGILEDTLVIMTADNGWQMPRGLAHVYDDGVHVPFAMRWGSGLPSGKRVEEFIGLEDLAPTFLEAAGLPVPMAMNGRSLLPLARGGRQKNRDAVFLERERHADVRKGHAGYPVRAVRTRDFLYIRNLRADRWPAGDPELAYAVGPYGDIDPSPTKELILAHREEAGVRLSFKLCFARRPPEELYDLRRDPGQTHNVAAEVSYAREKQDLSRRLEDWRHRTADPRIRQDDDAFDRMPYYGPPAGRTGSQRGREKGESPSRPPGGGSIP